MKKLAYLCLQTTREGQASYAHVHEIIKGLRKRGWRVNLYEPVYAASNRSPNPLQRILEFVQTQWRLWNTGRPDILYVRMHFATWPTALWARLRGIPIVQEVNGPYEDLFVAWPFTRRFAWLFKWLMKDQLRQADVIIAVTPQLAEWSRVEGGKKTYVISNGANTEMFQPNAQPDPELNLPPEYVVFFGALAPWQGIDAMLSAVKDPYWPQNVKLVIVGDGIARSKVKSTAAHSSLLWYLGPQPYSRMPGIVAASLAALVPTTDPMGRSRKGLAPLKLFESLACGVPVIVSDLPGMAELVRENKCGLVIPPNDPKALAQAVNYLYRHPEQRSRMGTKGRELVVYDHSWDKKAEDTANVLKEILA